MAEYVAQYVPASHAADLRRFTAFAERLNRNDRDGHVRTTDRRDAVAMFEFFAAAKGRLPIAAARYHVCRHDEGIGNCSAAVVEG